VSDEDYHAAERALRTLNAVRKRLTHKMLSSIIAEVAPQVSAQLEEIAPKLGWTQAEEDEDREEKEEQARKEKEAEEAAARAAAAAAAQKELEEKNNAGAPLLARQASERRAATAASTSKDSDAMTAKPLASVAGAPVSPIATTVTSPVPEAAAAHKGPKPLKPEDYPMQVSIYLGLLIAYLAFDRGLNDQAMAQADSLFERVWVAGTPTGNDALLRQIATLQGLAYERAGGVPALAQLRTRMITLLPTAVRFAAYGLQAVIINTVLRSFLQEGLYAQANKFRLNVQFPDDTKVPAGLSARFYFYTARIQALQLQYASALDSVTHALRKAPTEAGYGFQQAATKLQVTLQLLLGEVPPRSLFNQPVMRNALASYYTLTKAVMEGSLQAFDEALSKPELVQAFERDSNLSLVKRMRQNVIYTALGKLTASYSRLPLSVVAERLQLKSEAEAELVVAKAIKDGSLEAQIDPEGKYLESRPATNLYVSDIPRSQLETRIQFCLDVHAEATKALRYPSDDLDDEFGLSDPKKKKKNTMSAAAAKQEKREESKKKDSDKK